MKNLYLNHVLDFQPDQYVAENPVVHLSELERKYKKLSKKCKKGEITKKKYKKKAKKLEKELRKTQELVACSGGLYKVSKATTSERTWWQDAFVQSAPKLVDLVAKVADSRGRK